MAGKMTKCKSCGAEIAKSAKACPNCGAKQKKFHWWYILLAFIILGAIGSLSNQDNGPQKVDDTDKSSAQSAFASSASSSQSSSATSSVPTTFGVGDKVELNGITVTLTGITQSNGSEFNKPKDGNVFVLCNFDIENNSDQDINVSSIASFEAYVDGYSTNMDLSAQITNDANQLDGAVAAGKKMAGAIGYQLPKDWKELEISFTPDFWSGKDITFVAANS